MKIALFVTISQKQFCIYFACVHLQCRYIDQFWRT